MKGETAMYTVKILNALSGYFLKDGNRYETNFLLTETTTDRGVRFELQRCTKACLQEGLQAIGDTVSLCYDKFGRVTSLYDC